MLFNREIPISYTFDFVVCGGGMSGVSAAITAARLGLKTALIEKLGCLGGVATSGQVNHILGGRKRNSKGKLIGKCVGGLFDEITQNLINTGDAIDPESLEGKINPHGWLEGLGEGVPFENEAMKRILDEFCIKSGVDVFFFTDIIDVEVLENKIETIVVHNKTGLFGIKAENFADATGDADISYLSGCPTEIGRTEDGKMGPASLEMHVDNVNKAELSKYIKNNKSPRFRDLIKKLRKKGIWCFPYDIFISVQLNNPDKFMINTIRQVGIDGTNGKSISNGMISGRKENYELFKIMKEYFPGFSNARIHSIAPIIGIRETRRIIGNYTLKVEDLINGTIFEDAIACSYYGWDLPDPNKPSYQPFHGKKRKLSYTQIPYRCLIPQNISNLIVIGRCISVDRDVLGPIRVMAPCMAMGQAAGIAASLVFKNKVSFKDASIYEIQELIKKSNGIIKPE